MKRIDCGSIRRCEAEVQTRLFVGWDRRSAWTTQSAMLSRPYP
jgi:hypothetical protein